MAITQREIDLLWGSERIASNTGVLLHRLLSPVLDDNSRVPFNLQVFPFEESVIAATTTKTTVRDELSGRAGLFMVFGALIAPRTLAEHCSPLATTYKLLDELICKITGQSVAEGGCDQLVTNMQQSHLHENDYLSTGQTEDILQAVEVEFGRRPIKKRMSLGHQRREGICKINQLWQLVPVARAEELRNRWGYLDVAIHLFALGLRRDEVQRLVSLCISRGVTWDVLLVEILLHRTVQAGRSQQWADAIRSALRN
jgi:hypothetical protein